MDLCAFEETTSGNKYVVCLLDIFSKYLWAHPLQSKKASLVAQFVKQVLDTHGKFAILQTDNGGEFANEELASLLELNNIGIRM